MASSNNNRATPDPQAARQMKVPTDENQIIAWAEHRRKMGKPITTEAQMKLNLAFVLGFQWVTWDQRIRSYVRPRVDVSDPNAPVRLTSNKVSSLLERVVAKVTKDAPEPECRPVTDNDNDVAAAKVGTRILGSEMNRLDWKPWLQRFMFWPGIVGFAYAHVRWDPDAGDKIETDDPDEALFHGQIALEIVPGFELAVDPSGDTMDQAKWAVRTTIMTREAAWERWGVELTGGGNRSLPMEVMALGNNAEAKSMSEDWVTVHQFWMVPCRSAPRGLVLTWSEQKIIEKKDYPYEHGKLPFVQCNMLPALGQREGRTWLTDLIPIQVDYNDSLSRMATIRRQLSPKIMAPTGSIDPTRVTSRVEVILYNPVGEKPTFDVPSSGWVNQFEVGMDRDDHDLGERAGVGDASQGKAAGTSAAASIMALQEADDTRMELTITELASFIQNVGWQMLMLVKQYWDEERVVRVWSDENILEAYRYLGSDVDEQLDVHVSSESAMPKSKSAQAQLIFELQARFPNLIDPQDVIRLLGMPGTDFLTRSLDVDTRKQYRENGQILVANSPEECPVVQAFDNHVVHLKVLNDFRKTSDYENLPPERRAMFDAHAAVHESLVLKQLGLTVPTPNPMVDPNAMQQSQMASAGPAGGQDPNGQVGFTSPYLTDPGGQGSQGQAMQGAGMSDGAIAAGAGIGQGAGHPGMVPGIPMDTQAAQLGQ